jgi:hypothetical protein
MERETVWFKHYPIRVGIGFGIPYGDTKFHLKSLGLLVPFQLLVNIWLHLPHPDVQPHDRIPGGRLPSGSLHQGIPDWRLLKIERVINYYH